MNDTILPTHSCFDDALDFIEHRIRADIRSADVLTLVHGICTAPDGESYAHAWVEERTTAWLLVWDSGLLEGVQIYYSVSAAEFATARGVQETTRYSVREALYENHRTSMYGPWKPEYLALCNQGHGKPRVFAPLKATT